MIVEREGERIEVTGLLAEIVDALLAEQASLDRLEFGSIEIDWGIGDLSVKTVSRKKVKRERVKECGK